MDLLNLEIQEGNLEKVNYLIGKNEISKNDQWMDYMLLKKAVRFTQKDIVKLFLDKGFRVNKSDYSSEEETPLHIAVKVGCFDTVKILLDNNASIKIYNLNDETPLILAAKQKKYAIVDLMLTKISYENFKNDENFSHMHIACIRNRVDIVKKFLQHGVGINDNVDLEAITYAGYTALHFAVKFQCLETIDFLLNYGADVTIQDTKKQSPLHIAFEIYNTQIIDLILSAHIYETKNPKNSEGVSHFHIACTRNNPQFVNQFLNYQNLDYLDSMKYGYFNCSSTTPLLLAIEYECTDVVRLLLDHSVKPNEVANLTSNALHLAYQVGNSEIISLIQAKLKCKKYSETNYKNLSELCIALLEGNKKKICNELENEKNTESRDLNWFPFWPGCTALHLAVHCKNIKVTQFILDKGTDITAKDNRGRTPLHLAFERNQLDLVDLILSYHTAIDTNAVNSNGLSHFHISCARTNLLVIMSFLENGEDVNKCVKFDSPFWPGFTPLHFAIRFQCVEVVKLLIKNGADITVKNGIDLTPLDQVIISSGNEDYDFALIKLLLLECKRRKLKLFPDHGISLLHIASAENDVKSIRRLAKPSTINKAIDLDCQRWSGFTPLHFAAYKNHNKAISALLKRGADISTRDGHGDTPLLVKFVSGGNELYREDLIKCSENPIGSVGISHFHVACRENDLEAVEYFLKLGVDVNKPISYGFTCRDNEGKSALHFAAEYSNIEVVRLLLEYGADVHARDVYWRTPLHSTNDAAIVYLLVEAGANIDARDQDMHTPLVNAYFGDEETDLELAAAFLRNGADINAQWPTGASVMEVTGAEMNLDYIIILMEHIKKIMILGFHVNDKNVIWYNSKLNEPDCSDFDEADFICKCLKELDDMSKTGIDSYTTLKDILYKNSNQMSRHSENVDFKKILNAENFEERFPIYGYLLELQLKRGLLRKPIMKSADISLKILAGCEMSNLCAEMIFQYLSDEDLRNFTLAVTDDIAIKKKNEVII